MTKCTTQQLIIISCATMLSACAGNSYKSTNPESSKDSQETHTLATNKHFASIASFSTLKDKDRAAILTMQGEYKVGFHFEETVILQAGYEWHDPKDTGAFETVLVIEDEPGRIVLQHILVTHSGHVVKHWRQDWFYETESRFEFVADQRWETRAIPEDKISKAWTQCVYEVSDAPRYCGTGKWNHRYGVSTWTSDRTWRPLPRREYTVRNDYNALNAENRHTVTALGWTHEQDNTKTIREGEKTKDTLVREFGFNDYRRIDGFDFTPAYNYWGKTKNYWRQVREAWAARLTNNKGVKINTAVDGMPIITATFGHATTIENDEANPEASDIETVLNEWVEVIEHDTNKNDN